MMKKRISLITVSSLLLILMLAVNANAAVSWVSTKECTPRLSFTGNTANCSLKVTTYDSNDSITATLILKRENDGGGYTTVRTWSSLTGTGALNFSDTHSPVYRGTYHLVAYVIVEGANGDDEITAEVIAFKN